MENGIPPWQMQCPNNKQETKSNQIQLQSTWTHLRNVESAKYLGCLISSDLRWTKHINSICGKANKTLGFLRRNLNIGSTTVKQNAYNSLVRPIVEYASTVWDPYTQKDIHTLEMVHRRGARYVCSQQGNRSSVDSMLDTLKWKSLQHRRRDAQLHMI